MTSNNKLIPENYKKKFFLIMGICSKCNEIPKKLVPGEIQAELICLPLMAVMNHFYNG